ncbi:MAG: tRNA (adenosine(37)-N6)-threonylcarbamoyltransferase complex dimerization subunit type 1 TsaB [Bacteroidetes bacterium]|jgi:tRNA threonylcarbamoyl adenosine modification protein YeaZ|nr:tRNA (adenosine(37)-N6)-threonylcarbamoyltransferase complex dimerization subunit type 1 TsaB [Bacteroidota bacterium]|tara:strand:- start:725 stop:1396 length:672 start_codon:yes stop_codon:yes gene_type:complete
MIKKILAYETSTNICSVAFQNTDGMVFEKRVQGRSVHSDNLFLFTQQLMKEHDFKIEDLNAVLVSNGPGSYTGLRIAASAIKGIMFGKDVNLFACNTLASFAMATKSDSEAIHSIIDARRNHVYHQAFKLDDELEILSEAKVTELSNLEEQIESGYTLIGTGIDRISKKALEDVQVFDDSFISAKSLISLFQLENNTDFCIKTHPEELNSNYISSSQVNNTKA